jgi:putative ABC transport system ATP-binding protein
MFDPEDPAVFSTWDTVEGTQTTTNMMLGIQLFLGVIGGLTLLVGGVGVANIMYAVVKERTREIGVKMALGARPSWITGPIVLEGLAYTLVGGLLGVLMAVAIIFLLGLIPTDGNAALELMGKPTLSVGIGIASAAVLGLIGLFSGYFPARRAANGNGGAGANGVVIQMNDITKVYDTGKIKVEALKGIDLSVEQGEFVAIVGPSGSGKSTLMNLIGCLDTPTGGEYRLRGEQVSGLGRDQLADIRNRRIGFVFQNFNLLPQISAFENVEMPLLFGGLSRKRRKERVTELMEKVDLADRMDHKPTELSGGQMQRVAIARALAMDPDIILADEPTGNLDTSSGTDILSLFEELWRQGTTMLIITHDPAMAKRAQRTVEIRDGLVN